jgi:putative transposase
MYKMRKSFHYRIYPTRKQATKMSAMLDQCRWLYNYLLAQRKDAYQAGEKVPSMYDQQGNFVRLKKERPTLSLVHIGNQSLEAARL